MEDKIMETNNPNVEPKNEEPESSKTSSFYELSRKILLASVGAAVIAQDEVSSFVDKLSERGEIVEKDARRLVKEVMDRREKMERERKTQAQSERSAAVTRADIDALNNRIAELSKKLDEMVAQSSQEEKKD
jgi:polyhydroxyalkanoate synthesis regulator phasin